MFKNLPKHSRKNAKVAILSSLPLIFASTVSASTLKTSDSIGLSQSDNKAELRQEFLNNSQPKTMADYLLMNGTNKTRTEVLQLSAKENPAQASTKAANSAHHEFKIYDAHAHLLGDQDRDGYYQKFSITFDADHDSSGWEVVYAKLYLSNDNGNTWIHYYTTDDFIIDADHSYDDYEVVTTLQTGYPADDYDVLIDLYEDGNNHDIVATYSNYDTNELAALPLESKNHDTKHSNPTSKSDGKGGGGNGIIALFALMLAATRKALVKSHNK